MSRETEYTVVIPCLNEEGNIGRLVKTLLAQDSKCRVLVMDNRSTDQTLVEAKLEGATVLTLDGSVSDIIKKGIFYSSTEKIIIMDGDWSHDPRIVPQMVESLKIHDMVYGYRSGSKDSLINRGISLLGKIQSFLLGPIIKDRMTGFFGVRRLNVTGVKLNQGPKPFLEYFVKSKPSSIIGIPYEFKKREVGESKLGRSTILFTGLFQLFKLHIHKYYQFVKYISVGGSGFLVFLGLLLLFKELIGLPYFTAALISGSISFFYNFTGHKIWTFALDDQIPLRSLPNTIWNLGHDNDDGDFDWWEWTSGLPHKRFKKTLGRHIKDLAGDGDSILSLGCGSSPILNLFDGQKVGVDINPEKINFFREHTNAKLMTGDIGKLTTDNFDGQKFDIILCNEVVEHLEGEDYWSCINLVSDLLKPNGRFILSTPDTSNKVGSFVENFLHGEFHTNLMTAKEMVEDIEDRTGLVYIESRNFLWDKIHLFVKGEPQVEEVRQVMFTNV